MTVAIRQLTQSDVDILAVMESANQPRPWTRSVFGDELGRGDRIYVGAFEEMSLLGFAGALISEDEAHVTNLLVAPDRRREGLARRLLVELIDHVLAAGAKHLTLEVRTRNEAAIALYRRFGLAPAGIRKGYYGDDDALVLWVHGIDGDDYARRLEGLR